MANSQDLVMSSMQDLINALRSTAYNSYNDAVVVNTMQKIPFRESFSGSELDASKWESSIGSGMTLSVSNGELTINAGTSSNSETVLTTKEIFTISNKTMFSFIPSQKISNQECYLELVSVDDNGNVDEQNCAAWVWENVIATTTTTMIYQVQNNGRPRVNSASIATGISSWTTGNGGVAEIEIAPDEVNFYTRTPNSSNGRSGFAPVHIDIPNPTKKYKIRLRIKNLSGAVASATTFKFKFICSYDYCELSTEITAGRGASTVSQSIPAYITGGNINGTVTANLSGNITPYADTSTNLAAGATYTGTSRDGGTSALANSRFRAVVMHTAGLTPGHLVYEQSADGTTWRETHRVPIPSDGLYRTFDLPWVLRYVRVKFINGATAQTAFFLATALIKSDGPFDTDKTLSFVHSTTALTAAGAFTGVTLDLGANHSINRHRAMVFADQAGTVYVDQSRDGTNWRATKSQAVVANTPIIVEENIVSRYTRVRYVNGATAQTAFELQSALIKN